MDPYLKFRDDKQANDRQKQQCANRSAYFLKKTLFVIT